QETHRSYKQKLEELTKLQTLCSSSITRQKKKLKDLSLELKKVKGSQENEDAQIKDIQENIKLRERTFSEMESFLPKKNGVGDAVFNFLLVWYYCTLTIRESILINNGSRIKGWWVLNHYISTFLSGVMLTWPDGLMYQIFRNQFLSFSMYQSFVQFLQYYYQSGCLYRLRALGERHNMDLTVGRRHYLSLKNPEGFSGNKLVDIMTTSPVSRDLLDTPELQTFRVPLVTHS
ncbi:hypothetical protein AB205_0060990, partial [Aquarana catesbeiana]